MSEPQTEAGKALLRRGSNNWTGSDWQLTFAANIAKAEAQARDAALAEAEAAWAEAKRTRWSMMTDVGEMAHEVDRLLRALRQQGGAS